MKRLNLKLVIILSVSTLCLGMGLYFGHAMQMQSGSVNLKKDADALAQQGRKERADALKKYMTYLKQNDGDAQAWASAGKLSIDVYNDAATEGDPKIYVELRSQAYALMKNAVRHNLDNRDLRQSFAEFLMKHGAFPEALDQLEWLTSPDRGKHDPKLDVMLAACYETREFFTSDPKKPGQSASEVYARLIGYNLKSQNFNSKSPATAPDEVSAYIGLARIMREKLDVKQPKQADAIMVHLVEVNNRSAAAHLARAKYLQVYPEKNDPERKNEANSEVATAVRLATPEGAKVPEDPDVILAAAANARAAAGEAARNHDDKEAQAHYEICKTFLTRGFKLFPKNVEMYRQWAMLQTDLGNRKDAVKKIKEGLILMPREPNLLWILSELQLQEGDLKAARWTIKEMSSVPTIAKPLLDLVSAQVMFADKQWLPASKEFERLSKEFARSPDHSLQALMSAAQCYQQLGEFDKQLDACREIFKATPENSEEHLTAQLGVASALMATGKTEEARKEYEKLREKLGAKALQSPHVWLPVFQFRIAEAAKAPPEERKQKFAQLDNLVKYMEDNQTAKPEAIALVKSEIQFHEGDLDAAFKTLKDAAAKSPDDPALWSGLATIALDKGKDKGIDAALDVLDKQAPPSVRGDVTLRLNRAGLIVRRGGDDDKVKTALKELGDDVDNLSVADRSRLWAGIGTAFYGRSDFENAISYWMKVAKDGPDDVKIRLSLIEVGRQLGNEKVMSQMVDDMRRIMGPGSEEALYAEAARSFGQVRIALQDRNSSGVNAPTLEPEERQKLNAAIKILDKVSRARPDWYQVAHTLADAELLVGNTDGAIEHYKQALKVGPADPRTVRPVVLLLMKSGRTSEAESIIDLVGREKMKEMQLGQFVVDTDAAKGAMPDALKEAIREVPEDAKDANAPYGHLWVGRLYAKSGDMTNAEKRFRLAVKTGPDSPETWLTLVEHLVTNKKKEEAAKSLMQARKELPEDRVNLVLGPGYEVIGENVLAEQYYRAAVDANPNDMPPHKLLALFLIRKNRTEEARKEVLTVLHAAQDKPAAKADLLWARRTLADILSATGDNEDFRRAKALLLANVKLNDVDSEDQLKLANLLATRWDEPASLREAQKYFESIKTPLSRSERMTLANIHDVLGNWSQARGEMLDLITQAQTPDAKLYTTYVEMLLRHDSVDEAANYLDEIAKLEKGESIMRARVLMKKFHPDEAAALISKILPPRPVAKDQVWLAKDQIWRLRTAALEMDKLGLDDKAEELYREYMTYVPGNGALQLASFLGHKGHVNEALDLCEKALKTEPAHNVLQAISDVLHGQPRRVEQAQLERVAKWYDRLLAENPGSTSLMLHYADFLILANEDAKAEQVFRDLINHSDLNATERAIAQNDLAFVLATQRKNLDEALRLVNEAGDLMGFRSDLLDTRGMVYLAMGRYADAANDFHEAVTVAQPSPIKFLHLAYARNLAKDREAARSAFHSAKDAGLNSSALNRSEQSMYEQLNKDIGP